ncbi:hypothetical protein SBOR_0409 [Sclerotinia borealis F-4128]|uniref:F-box domain-containing protein n=1 Tax=Sclerotinia borealis (strain F-4128) TaxID=1432307 RepID=W9CQU5_SCLBF|nr:hypothetical protein SBOR_0409 [Sclerotinia borealis F-4128]
MENHEKFLHGRLDPGIESTVQLVEGVESPDTSTFSSSQDAPSPILSYAKNAVFPGIRSSNETRLKLAHLPVELIRQISSYLSPCDLIKFGKTCKTLSEVAKTDFLWRRLVQENVPGINLDSPSPCESFKELYKAHDPHWFLTKNKIWFADVPNFGQLIISKYHPETGSIRLHRLMAQRSPPQFAAWEDDSQVIVHSFDPVVHLSKHNLRLDLDAYSHRSLSDMGEAERRLNGEVQMTREDEGFDSRAYSKFMLAKTFVFENPPSLPQADKWPPPNIPAKSRVPRTSVCAQQSSSSSCCRLGDRSQIDEESFRTRQWLEMNGLVRIGEQVCTWSTLDFSLYTPTEDKPYSGIFVGDYSGHGAEFLLIDHRDGSRRHEESNISDRKEDESLEAWEARKKHARIYKGSLVATKLTGDPNIPRGEVSWVADDIGEKGLVRYGDQAWPGARIVKSRGQIANEGYIYPKFIQTQLIMISHDVLAQYWVPFGHISFFRRVDIDALVKLEPGMLASGMMSPLYST